MKGIIKNAYKLLTEDNLSYLGFIANLGLVTFSYILLWSTKVLFHLNDVSQITNLHIFSAIYFLLFFYNYKWAIGENNKFNLGFELSATMVSLTIIILYLINLF
tara:strand:+ start:60 stop:371 length:312 start_codon:yes stop_codon:yes gene_type:complete